MGFSEGKEGLNITKCHMKDFYEDLQNKLTLVTGMVPYEDFGLTLEDVRKPMLVVGQPGIGKTCGIISIVKNINAKLAEQGSSIKLGFKKILLGQTVVGSMQGIPVSLPDGRVVRVQMPDLPDPNRDGEYGVLFLDEITTADEMQVQPALGLADDSRNLGEYTLPDHWIVVAAGNGPDCTNFIRLDDMTISRFVGYDIDYKFKTDFRPYAHESNLNSDIIAYLNFSPDDCIRVISEDTDEAGKLFPCPRTWERLSIELKMRQALGKPVSLEEMANFAGRIIGRKTGNAFSAFVQFKKVMTYDIDKIFDGTENPPTMAMQKEVFHLLLQGLIKKSEEMISLEISNTGNRVPEAIFPQLSNMVKWLLHPDMSLENQILAVFEIGRECKALNAVLCNFKFTKMCPDFDKFFEEHSELIASDFDNLKAFGV